MEFSIARNELLAGLYLAQGVAERRTTIPVLGNILIEADREQVVVTATDQEVGVRRSCHAEIRRPGALCTGARKLYEMVRELPDVPVLFRLQDNQWIEITCGRSKFRLVGIDPEEFPAMPARAGGGAEVRIGGELLAAMIERTFFAISADESRLALNGVYVETPEPGKLRMVATDGHRLAMVTRPVVSGELREGVILSRKSVGEIRKTLEVGEGEVVLAVADGVAYLERDRVDVSMRLVAAEFPDYRQVIPSEHRRVLTVRAGDMMAALRRVSVVSSDRTRGVKLTLSEAGVELSSINPEVGEASEEVDGAFEGEPLSVGFNARYLMDALALEGPEAEVELLLNDEVSPGVLRFREDPDYCYIVMPMRL